MFAWTIKGADGVGIVEVQISRSKGRPVQRSAALLANQKVKCVRCGEYNDTGSAKAYTGPASRK